MFNLPPMSLKLIWETGEWDPSCRFHDVNDFGVDIDLDLTKPTVGYSSVSALIPGPGIMSKG